MTDRAELVTISAVALLLPLAGVVRVLVQRTRVIDYSAAKTLYSIGCELAIIAVAAVILRKRGWSARPFRVVIKPLTIVVAVLLTIVYIWTTWIVVTTAMHFVPEVRIVIRHAAPVWLTVAFLVLNSFFEEAFASAYLVEAFERNGIKHVVAWSACIRAVYHLYQGAASAVCVFLLGCALASIYRRERNIGIPFAAHTIINVVIFYFARTG